MPRLDRAPRNVRCRGTAKSTGQQCKNQAIRGGFTCRVHGTAKGTPARAAADRRIEQERVNREMTKAAATYGLPRDIDPGQAMLEEVQRTAGHVLWLQMQVNTIPQAELFDDKHAVLLATYRQERAHYGRVTTDAVRCGLKVKQLDLLEELAQNVVRAMRVMAEELGFSPDDPRVVAGSARGLRVIDGQLAGGEDVERQAIGE